MTNFNDYNPYMYVRGNPMRYTDPTGYASQYTDGGVVLDTVTVYPKTYDAQNYSHNTSINMAQQHANTVVNNTINSQTNYNSPSVNVSGSHGIRNKITTTSSIDKKSGAHQYKIRGLICSRGPKCDESYADRVYGHVNRNDIPFTSNDLGSGKRNLISFLPRPLGSQPIYHQEVPSARMSLNITLEGHNFHPGTVLHEVGFYNGILNYTVTGNGFGDALGFNNWIGIMLFMPGVENVVHTFGR